MENMKKTITCVVCPVGCTIDVVYNSTEIIDVSGNNCGRGYKYATAEAISPERILTTTVASTSASFPRIPVRSRTPIPKDRVFEAVKALRTVKISLPVKVGDIVACNIADTGVDIIAARSVDE